MGMSPYCRNDDPSMSQFRRGFQAGGALGAGHFPLNANDHWQVRRLTDGTCTEVIDDPGPVLVALLTALGNDVWLEEGDRHNV